MVPQLLLKKKSHQSVKSLQVRYLTRVSMVRGQEKCRLSPLSTFFQSFFYNDGTAATAKPDSGIYCMQQLFGWVSEVT